MLRSTTFDNYLAACESVEQILDLCARALYNRYHVSAFITTGVGGDGAAIRSQRINHWAGNRVTQENQSEEQTITSFVSEIGIDHKQSATPWLKVSPVGQAGDTPNGVFF